MAAEFKCWGIMINLLFLLRIYFILLFIKWFGSFKFFVAFAWFEIVEVAHLFSTFLVDILKTLKQTLCINSFVKYEVEPVFWA